MALRCCKSTSKNLYIWLTNSTNSSDKVCRFEQLCINYANECLQQLFVNLTLKVLESGCSTNSFVDLPHRLSKTSTSGKALPGSRSSSSTTSLFASSLSILSKGSCRCWTMLACNQASQMSMQAHPRQTNISCGSGKQSDDTFLSALAHTFGGRKNERFSCWDDNKSLERNQFMLQ